MTTNMMTKVNDMSFTAKRQMARTLAFALNAVTGADLNSKKRAATVMTSLMVASTAMCTMSASANGEVNLSEVTSPVLGLVRSVLKVLIPLVAAVGAIFCVSLGVKFAKAEEPQEREKAKQHLKNAIIGFILIFILIVVLSWLEPIMTQWMIDNQKKTATQASSAT